MPRYALIVGIGQQYQYLSRLTKPEGDAQRVHDLLKQRGDFQDIQLLIDGVTFGCLGSALETLLLKRANRDDVVIYFTGHGFIAGETEDDQEGYLATADCQVELAGDRVLNQRRGLSFRRLNGLVQRANLASLVMFLDCCHSGYALEQGTIQAGLSAFIDRNYCLIAACRGFEQAYAEREDRHSLFTGALVAGLQSPPEAGDITTSGLFQRISAELRGVGQEPTWLNAGTDVVVVRSRHQPIAPVEDETSEPYQGLRAFTPETRRFFFGRDREIVQIVQHLGRGAVVPVIGPSGSGKSSVVRAGVVPWAQEQGWRVLEPWMPGLEPWGEVKRSFRQVFGNRDIGAVYGHLEADWGAVVAMWPPGPPTLMVVDQFEELFTVCRDGAGRRRVLDWLAAVWQGPEPVVRVVMTMRADFVPQWLACHQLMPMIQQGAVWLGPLVGADLEQAITGPAACLNYQVPGELLGLILDDGATEPNCLPLLEFALAELWQQRDRTQHQLTVAAYRAMGRLQGALAQRAETLYQRDLKTERERQICRDLCVALVRIGPEGVDTRCRQEWQRLLAQQAAGPDQQIWVDVQEALVAGRLLVRDGKNGELLDLAHEALMGGWPRFVEWRQENRAQHLLVQRLKDAQQEWEEKGQDDAYLVQGGLLAELREQWGALAVSAGPLRDFFDHSDAQEQGRVAALEKALAEAQLRETCTRLNTAPNTNPLEKHLLAIQAVTISQVKFQGEVISPVQDVLHRAFTHPCDFMRWQCHSGSVNAVAFSPQGDRVVSAGRNGTVRLWDLAGNQIGKPWQGHGNEVRGVALSPQGDRVVSAGADGTVRLWDLAGNQIGDPWQAHSDIFLGGGGEAVAFNPQGNQVASAGADGTVRLWDLAGNQIGKPWQGHEGWVNAVAFRSQGDRVASAGADGTVRLWDLAGNQIGDPWQGHEGWVRAVAFSPQGDRIASAGDDGTVRLWDLEGAQIGPPWQGHSSSVLAVAFSPQGDRVASAGADSTVRLWDLAGTQLGKPWQGHNGYVNAVIFSPQGDRVASAGADGTVHLWDLAGIQLDNLWQGHDSTILAVAFSPQGDRVASAGADGTVRLWDLAGTQLDKPWWGHDGHINAVAFSPQGEQVVSAGEDCTLRLWDLADNQIGNPWQGHQEWVRAVAFSPQGDRVVSAGEDCTLRLWDLAGNQIGNPWQGHSGGVFSGVYAVAFSPQGDRVVSAGSDGTLRLWDLEGAQIGAPWQGHSGSVLAVAFSPQGDRVASAGADSTVRLWDLAGTQIGAPWQGHAGTVLAVAFSPQGDRVVSAGDDGTVRLWDLAGGQIGAPWQGHAGRVLAVAFSPQGDRVVSAGDDGTVRLWPGGTWRDWLYACSLRLLRQRCLTRPRSDLERQVAAFCQQQVWGRQDLARYYQAQAVALAQDGERGAAAAKLEEARKLAPDLDLGQFF